MDIESGEDQVPAVGGGGGGFGFGFGVFFFFFCLNYRKLRRRKWGNRWSVVEGSAIFQLKQRRVRVRLEAFVPCSNFPASLLLAGTLVGGFGEWEDEIPGP